MTRIFLLSLLLALAVPAVAPPAAAAADEKILDATIDRYMQEASRWEPRIKQAARTMFWILATISMVFTFAFMFVKGNATLGDFFGEFLKFVVTTGFFYWLLENGSAIAKAIITSFGQLGREASSTYQEELSPTNLLWFALDLVVRSCSSFGEQDIATSVIALLLSIAIAVLFAVIAAMMVLLLCSAWVLVYAGVIYLGFGGGRWTSDIAVNYFKTVLGLGVQTFTFCLLVGIGQSQIERLIAESTQMKNVTVKGYVYDSTIATTSMTITEACIILVFTVVLFMLVKTVPQMVAGVISGSSTGGIHLGGSGSAIAGAAAVASGGAMIAMQAAGAGMALNSAYQQSQTNMAEGMGKFDGAIFSGGLSGAMDKRLTFASDMMSNLVSGAKETAADNIQKTTTGGRMSANIDADNAAALAGAAKADNTDPAPGNASGDGSASVSGDSAAANTGGDAGGSFAGGASLSSGSTASAPLNDYAAGLASYDPGKIGLPDDK